MNAQLWVRINRRVLLIMNNPKGCREHAAGVVRGLATAGIVTALATSLPFEVYAGEDNDTLVWSTASEIGSLDTYYANMRETLILTYAMCDSLIYRDPETGNYEGLLATDWTWIDDSTLELTIRSGVTFHDGNELTPDDVAYTLNHISDPETPSQVSFLSNWIDRVEVTGPQTVKVHAKAPTPAALEYLGGATPIFQAGHYDDAPKLGDGNSDFGAVQPVCTGPYEVDDFVPGETVTLKKYDGYFADSPKGQPQIGAIQFRTIRDPEAQIAELVTGGIDWIWGVPSENAEILSQQPGISVASAPTMRMSFLSLDAAGRSGDTPVTDVRVRQAIAYAIDRDAIVDSLAGEGAVVLKSMCVPDQAGCTTDVKQYDYDPDKARALLAEAGYDDGLNLPFYAYRDRPYSEAVMNYMREVGISTDLQFLKWGALRPTLSGGEAEVAHLTNGSNGILDATASLGYYFGGGEMDYARNEELSGWLSEAGRTTDPNARATLYEKAASKIADEAYFVPLFLYGRTYAYTSDLNFPATGDELAHFYRASWN